MKPKFCFLAAVIAVAGFVFLAEAAPQDKLIRARVAIPAISLAQLPLEVGVQVGGRVGLGVSVIVGFKVGAT